MGNLVMLGNMVLDDTSPFETGGHKHTTPLTRAKMQSMPIADWTRHLSMGSVIQHVLMTTHVKWIVCSRTTVFPSHDTSTD